MKDWRKGWEGLTDGVRMGLGATMVRMESLNEERPGGLADPEASGARLFGRMVAECPEMEPLLEKAREVVESVEAGEVRDFVAEVRRWFRGRQGG